MKEIKGMLREISLVSLCLIAQLSTLYSILKKTWEQAFSMQIGKHSSFYWKMSKHLGSNENIVSKSSLFPPKSSLTYIYKIFSKADHWEIKAKPLSSQTKENPLGLGMHLSEALVSCVKLRI